MTFRPLVLCILDGWGYSEDIEYNAIAMAHLPFFQELLKTRPNSLLQASGLAVGVPIGQIGNSEVGHMTIGAGRIITQDLASIDAVIKGNALHAKLAATISYLKMHNKALHLIGLLSDGGVHSHIDHIVAIANILRENEVKFYIHAITDGRDTSPQSAKIYLDIMYSHSVSVASICGRFYAMDRDCRFDRTERYYKALVDLEAEVFQDLSGVFAENPKDEFIAPHISKDYCGMEDGDVIFFANFRADRMRQLAEAFLDKDFKGFQTKNLSVTGISMTSYSERLSAMMSSLFPAREVHETLGEVIANCGLKQLRIAETEKYAHVTYFFNGGREEAYENEERILIPSPKVMTYDQCPEMSADQLTDALISQIQLQKYDFICVNFANADMVGHTADLRATILACETIDRCLQRIATVLAEHRVDLLITADHGNAEQLFDLKAGCFNTAHTLNPVPLIYVGTQNISLRHGELQDVAPTVLRLMRIVQPEVMTGVALI